ncbi:MAG TPA: hypothetical protein VFE39_03240 [Pseudonocardia sp.]|jgi:hypothetical protein|nr:hypothetical protein [Pseudonocardia sp.]
MIDADGHPGMMLDPDVAVRIAAAPSLPEDAAEAADLDDPVNA